jgi:hypothetical protein
MANPKKCMINKSESRTLRRVRTIGYITLLIKAVKIINHTLVSFLAFSKVLSIKASIREHNKVM